MLQDGLSTPRNPSTASGESDGYRLRGTPCVPGLHAPLANSKFNFQTAHHPRRRGERRDLYAAAVVLGKAVRRLSRNNPSLWLCVPAFAGTTTWTNFQKCTSAFSRRDAPEVCVNFRALKSEGAGNAGCTLHPRSRVQNCAKKTHTSIQVQRRQSDIPCAMVLRLISRSPRRSGFLVTVACDAATANLTPASRRQDHTTSPSA
jgi:hypothetical protein